MICLQVDLYLILEYLEIHSSSNINQEKPDPTFNFFNIVCFLKTKKLPVVLSQRVTLKPVVNRTQRYASG